jgi:ACS family hexuronate transporter-like MFS transporter
VTSRWAILALLTGSHALGAFAVLAVAPLSPLLLEALGLGRVAVGLFLPAAYLGGVLMSLPAGWFTDRFGARPTLAAGQALTGVAVALAALSPGLPLLLALLFVGGLGWSVVNPTTGKAILDWFPPKERGLAMGVKQTGLTLGGIGAALVLPALALAAGWRWALLGAGGASLLSAGLVLAAYRSPVAVREAAEAERPRLADLRPLLSRPGLLAVLLSGLVLSAVQTSLLSYLALYAKEVLGLSVVAAGGLLALAQGGGAAGRLGGGLLSDRLLGGRRRPGVIATALVGAACYAVLAYGGPGLAGWAGALAVVAGAGAFGWVGLYFTLVAEVGGPRHAGLLTGVAVAFAWSGVLVGPPSFGLLLEATGSYRVSWLALSAAAVGAAVALARLKPLVPRG